MCVSACVPKTTQLLAQELVFQSGDPAPSGIVDFHGAPLFVSTNVCAKKSTKTIIKPLNKMQNKNKNHNNSEISK